MNILEKLPKNVRLQACPFCGAMVIPFTTTGGDIWLIEMDRTNHQLTCGQLPLDMKVWSEAIRRHCTCYDYLLYKKALNS